jgi:ankyrin repeat protein
MKKINSLLLCTLLYSCNSFTLSQTTEKIFQEIREGQKEAVKQRLDKGENFAIQDAHGNTPLHVAVEIGDEETIKMLTEYYDHCNSWWTYYFAGPTLPNINEINNDGNTALLCASAKEYIAIVALLLKKKADMKIFNKAHFSAAFIAISKDNPDLLRLLESNGLDFSKHKRENGCNICHYATEENKQNTIAYCAEKTSLLAAKNNNGFTPICKAIDAENITALRAFKEKGFNFNLTVANELPSLHYATQKSKKKVIDFLIENNISIDSFDESGNAPIHHAVFDNNEIMMNFLQSRNATINKRNQKGRDILLIAAQCGHLELTKKIARLSGIDINGRDDDGYTSVMIATIEQNHDIMKLLINLGVNIRLTDKKRENVLHKIARNGDLTGANIVIKQDKVLLTDSNIDGDTPLFVAIQNKQIALARELFDYNSPITTHNNKDNTILHEIAKTNNKSLYDKLLSKKISLAEFINHKNKDGIAPLSFAAQQTGPTDILIALIESKADINTEDYEGRTPLHHASEHDNIEALRILRNHGASCEKRTKNGNTFAHSAAEKGSTLILTDCTKYHENLLSQRNKNNETPFIITARKGYLEDTKLLLRNEDYMSHDIDIAITLARENRNAVLQFLLKKDAQRKNEDQEITNIYATTVPFREENKKTQQNIGQENWVHFLLAYGMYTPTTPNYYSATQLYEMPQSKRAQIRKEYIACHEYELNAHMNFATLLRNIQEKENARIEKCNRQRDAHILEQERQRKHTAALEGQFVPVYVQNSQTKATQNNNAEENQVKAEECCVCLQEKNDAKSMPCEHCKIGSSRICNECLGEILKTSKQCPTCNKASLYQRNQPSPIKQ